MYILLFMSISIITFIQLSVARERLHWVTFDWLASSEELFSDELRFLEDWKQG